MQFTSFVYLAGPSARIYQTVWYAIKCQTVLPWEIPNRYSSLVALRSSTKVSSRPVDPYNPTIPTTPIRVNNPPPTTRDEDPVPHTEYAFRLAQHTYTKNGYLRMDRRCPRSSTMVMIAIIIITQDDDNSPPFGDIIFLL